MTRRKPDIFLLAAVAGGVLYPFLVYAGFGKFPVSLFIFIGVALMALRLVALRRSPDFKLWARLFVVACILLIAAIFLFPAHGAEAYPVVISLSAAAAFGLSLAFPPSLVERIARYTEPDLPPEGVRYTRNVTILWTAVLILNAAISAAVAAWGSVGQWALWNGLLSYLYMGVVFAGEYAVRRIVRR